jgi:hypothetical protein
LATGFIQFNAFLASLKSAFGFSRFPFTFRRACWRRSASDAGSIFLLDPIELAEQRAQVLGASTVQLTFGGGECRLFSCGLLSVGRDGVVGNAKIVRGVQEFAEQPIGFEQLMPQSVTAWSRPR